MTDSDGKPYTLEEVSRLVLKSNELGVVVNRNRLWATARDLQYELMQPDHDFCTCTSKAESEVLRHELKVETEERQHAEARAQLFERMLLDRTTLPHGTF